MVASHIELEEKYGLPNRAALPDFSSIGNVHRVDHRQHTMVAAYWDTPDLRLAREGITLRRRTGGSDDGWHLKLPVGNAREEFEFPLGPAKEEPPGELTRLVTAYVRTSALARVATLRTQRSVTLLSDQVGAGLVEIDDDRVTATIVSSGRRTSFREIEAELLCEDPAILSSVNQCLLDSGATSLALVPKVVQALGSDASGPSVLGVIPDSVPQSSAVGELLKAELCTVTRSLLQLDSAVRLDRPDAVHKMRVACRRYRSIVGTFSPLLRSFDVTSINAELVWLASSLGAPRDAEVIRDRLVGELAGLPARFVDGPVVASVTTALDARHTTAYASLVSDLESDRYRSTLDDLIAFALEPPMILAANGSAAAMAPPLVDKVWLRLEHRIKQAGKATGDRQVELLHSARRIAKRARYASEACIRAFGAEARTLGAAMESVQTVLGDFQDANVATDVVLQFAGEASARGESTFTYGVLAASEQARAAAARAALADVWKASSAKKLRRWLRSRR